MRFFIANIQFLLLKIQHYPATLHYLELGRHAEKLFVIAAEIRGGLYNRLENQRSPHQN